MGKNKYIFFYIIICIFLFGFITSRFGPFWGFTEQEQSEVEIPEDAVKIFADSNNDIFSYHEDGTKYQLNILDPNTGFTPPLVIGTLTLDSGSITDSSSDISFGDTNITTTGNIIANTYYGDGSNLTGITIGPTGLEDGDYGDWSVSGGSATLDAGVVSDNEINFSEVILTDFDSQTAWRLFYSDGSNNVTELALGTSGQYLKSDGTTSAPTWDTPSGGGSASCIEASDGDPNDALCADASGNLTASSSVSVDFSGIIWFKFPVSNGDVTADAAGKTFYDYLEDQWVWYDPSGGELDGEEVADTAIKYFSFDIDPGDWYDGDADIFVITVGDNFPSGIKIDEWKTSCNTSSPDVEIDADLFYADDWATLANLTIMDALDTSSGVSSEDYDPNINSGNAVANGKVIGVRINLDPEGTCIQWKVEVWGHAID